MFTVGALVVAVALGLFLFWVAQRCAEGSEGRGPATIFGIIFLIIGILVFLIAGILDPHTKQIENFATVQEVNKAIKLHEERRDALSDVVRRELQKYPEYEKEIMGKINPMMLLNFPNLKSNETMAKTVDELLKLENTVYGLREKLLAVQKEIYAREISPWTVCVKSHRSFFGKENPIASQ